MHATLNELSEESQRLLINFIDVDTKLGFTFAELAATEHGLGNQEHCRKAKAHAQAALDAVKYFLQRIEDSGVREEVQQRCRLLEQVISAL